MIPYQFPDGVTIDLQNLIAIDEILHINASINEPSDWTWGEYYYDLTFKFSSQKVRRFSGFGNGDGYKEKLITERQQLFEDWKNGVSRCLVK
jgi:hypothetical protein